MTEPTIGIGIGPRERRWLVIFLAIGSAYFGILLTQIVLDILGGFSQIFLILFLAWLLAFVMSPLVGFLQARLALPRPAIVALSYLVALLTLGFVLFYTGSAITQQVGELTEDFPSTARQIEATLAGWQQSLEVGRLRVDLVGLFETASSSVEAIGGQIFERARDIAGVTIAALGSLVLIIIISLYMVMDVDRITSRVERLIPRRFSDELAIFERSVGRAFGGFLRAQLILAMLQSVLVGLIGVAFEIPYLFLVGTLSALAMLIPFFGPPLALIPPVVAAAIFVPDALLPVTLILLVTQTLIVNWLQPRLMQGALGMHPILVLVALLVGAQVAGVWGALFGIPVIAVINVFFSYAVESAVPNSALPEEERLGHVNEHTMVRVSKEQVADETHPHIHVHRSLREDGSEDVRIEIDEDRAPA